MIFWLKKLFLNPVSIGAVMPSSPYLARLMAGFIPPHSTVLELGPGTGVITKEIAKRVPSHKIQLIEYDADLAATCKKQFPDISVLTGDAETILTHSTEVYSAIISGIPFGAMDKEKTKRLFHLIHTHLAPGGIFIMFQYSWITYRALQKEFGQVKTSFTPWNVPPAFVYRAKKQEEHTT